MIWTAVGLAEHVQLRIHLMKNQNTELCIEHYLLQHDQYAIVS